MGCSSWCISNSVQLLTHILKKFAFLLTNASCLMSFNFGNWMTIKGGAATRFRVEQSKKILDQYVYSL